MSYLLSSQSKAFKDPGINVYIFVLQHRRYLGNIGTRDTFLIKVQGVQPSNPRDRNKEGF
jgi:hypothetical protein